MGIWGRGMKRRSSDGMRARFFLNSVKKKYEEKKDR